MLINYLLELGMYEAARQMEQLGHDAEITEEKMLAILDAEVTVRKQRALSRRLKQARFPVEKEWVELDLSLNPKIDFAQIKTHFDGHFVEQKKNLCFVGCQGTGKTHCLIALGRELCRKGKTVKFYTACELVNILEEAKANLTLTKIMKTLQRPHLLVLDELGFVPFSEKGARLLFDVFASRYERGSIAVSTNLTFDKCVQVFGTVELTVALVDRFTHHATIISFFDGQSVRNLEARKRLKNKLNTGKSSLNKTFSDSQISP